MRAALSTRPSSSITVSAASPAGAGEVVAPERGRVDDAAVHARKGLLVNRAPRDDRRRGHVTAAQRLGQGEDVGLQAPVLEGEPFAGAAEAGLHLVADEKRAVLAAERLRAVVVIVLRELHALALHQLDDKRRRRRRFFNSCSSSATSPIATVSQPGTNGPKPSWNAGLPVTESAP